MVFAEDSWKSLSAGAVCWQHSGRLGCECKAVLAPSWGRGRYDKDSATGKQQWGGSQSKLRLSGMGIAFLLLGWCGYHNGSSVPLKCCSDNGPASHAFGEGASSFTETQSPPQTLFPLAALIPCPAKLPSRDAVAVSFDRGGFRNCFKSTWGQRYPCPPSPLPLTAHRYCQEFH